MKHSVGNRLLSAAKFVRQGAYFADVGTDHAYLPLFLLGEGIIERAVCADINEGPLESARKNAAEAGFFDKIIFKLSDGAAELSDMGITDYAICGMGGELIADIIDRAPHLKDSAVNLILQPMTRQASLRRYLYENGFAVVGESYSYDAGKYYLCMLVKYSGVSRKISDFEAEFGDLSDARDMSSEKRGYIDGKLKALYKAALGKEASGQPDSTERRMINEYECILSGGNENDG